MSDEIRIIRQTTAEEDTNRRGLTELLRAAPIPEGELLENLPLFLDRPTVTRLLFLHDLYRRILDVHGVVLELGCRFGRNLALLSSFRGMYEPYNHTRRIVGFDTFAGFPSVHEKDGGAGAAGDYGVGDDYAGYLDEVLAAHERGSPLSHIRKHELVAGDVTETLPRYLEEHPETIVALAYFDLDLYEPTKACLEAIAPYLTKGSVLGFDELAAPLWPGETAALREVLGLGRHAIRRWSAGSVPSYVVID